MNRKQKKIVARIVIVLVVVVAVTVAVVSIVTRTPKPDVVGIYTAQNGREIHLDKDGTFTEIGGLPSIGTATRVPMRYWVTGNNITVGTGKSNSSKGPTTFKVEGKNGLVGWNTVWVKQLVRPNRPTSLVGTYTSNSSDGETLALDKNGAVYVTQPEPTGETVGSGTWVATKNTVTVTYPDLEMKNTLKTTYAINGKSLVWQGKELVKTSDRAIVPATL